MAVNEIRGVCVVRDTAGMREQREREGRQQAPASARCLAHRLTTRDADVDDGHAGRQRQRDINVDTTIRLRSLMR